MTRPVLPLQLATILPLILLLGALVSADSVPRLIERSESRHRGIPTLSLTVGIERPALAADVETSEEWRREERWITDPHTGVEERIVLEGPAPDLSLKSFLVAIPEGYAAPETPTPVAVEFYDVETGELVEDLGAIEAEMRAAQVGLVRAAQVFYRLPDVDRDVEARLAVEIPAAAGPQTLAPSRVPVPHSLSQLFVNGDDAIVLTNSRHRGTTPGLFPPPGDTRISFKAEHRIYRVALEDLGVEPEDVDMIQLIHHDTVLPFDVIGEDIVFYGQRRVTTTDTDDSVFVQLVVEGASPRLSARPAFENVEVPESPTEVSVARNRRYDWDLQYQPAVISLPLGEKFVFHRLRFPGNATIPNSGTYQLPIRDVLTNTFISLRVEMHGQNQNNNYNPDHYADITFAGSAMPRTSWEGRTKHIANFSFNLPSLPSGPVETFAFTHLIPGDSPVTHPQQGNSADEQTLDIVEVTYLGQPRLEVGGFGRLRLTPAGAPRRVTMAGLPAGTQSEDLLVWDVTNPNNPVRVVDPIVFTDDSGTVGVTFEAPASLTIFQIERLENLASPTEIVGSELFPDPLPSDTVLRGIVVRDPLFAGAMKPWVDHRGPGILELDPQAAYNAFNGGQASPDALRDALRELIESEPDSVAVPFVLLVGHGSFDRKNRLGFKDAPWIPGFLELSVVFNFDTITGIGTTIENTVDLNYGLLFGDDNLLDVKLTRWPAKTPADIQRVVARALAHDAAADALTRTDRPAVFLADNEGAFIQDQAIWNNIWSGNGFSILLMTRNQPVAELGGLTNTAAIRKALDRRDAEDDALGASFIFYTGHGNFDRWAGTIASSFDTSENPITNANITTYDTMGQWTVAATFTCLNGNYATPGQGRLSMSEAWLFGSDFGATANIAPSSVDFYNEQRLLQGAYITQLGKENPVERAMTIGAMSHRASVAYATSHPGLMKTLREYIVFGDPLALTTVVPQEAELVVTLESSDQYVQIDEPFVLTLTVSNIGVHEARGTSVEVAPPVGYELLDIIKPWGEFTDHGELWEVELGTLIPGQSAVILLQVNPKPEAISPGQFTASTFSITTVDDETAMDSATVIIGEPPTVSEMMAIY